ncbi:MAG: exported protein of unknown function [Rhodoglobus sp.]|nr:exported protein of unknown function [Rhodoglobus sp.]
MGLWRYSRLLMLAIFIATFGVGTAYATTSTSNTYQVSETQFNSGSSVQQCSAQYCAKASIGDTTAGNTNTTSGGTATFGPITDSDPRLEVIIDPGVSNLGVLSAETTATKTTTVRIRNYLGGGYTLQIVGDPPKFAGHTLASPSTPAASSAGTEQFAINVADNSTPNVGAVPQQVPGDVITFGQGESGYNTPNLFKYISEGVIARGIANSGRTDYTISFVVNISNATPAGHYEGEYEALVVPAY